MNFREFVTRLDELGLLKKITREVSTEYEIATVMKLLDGQPVLFENVKGSSLPVVANVCGNRELVAKGLEVPEDELIKRLANAVEKPKEPAKRTAKNYTEIEPNLSKLPILTYYPNDGGPYIASAIALSNDAEYGINASYHRMMKIDDTSLVLRILQRDFDMYIQRGLKDFAICIGNPVPIMLGAAISAGTGISELAIANALAETPVIELGGHTVPESEIVMIAEFTGDLHEEGPFLDLTETPDIVREQRVARIKKIFIREGALFHGLLPGGLEHKMLMGMPREPTVFREVSKVCQCNGVYITPGGASWLHAVVSITKKQPDDGIKAIHAAFKGHASMKHVYIVDDDIDIHDPHEVEWAMATRFQGHKGLVILEKQKGSSLDPSSDLETRETTKLGFDLTIPDNRDQSEFRKPPLPMTVNLDDYIDSC